MTGVPRDRRRDRQGLRARPDVGVLLDRLPADVPGAVRRRLHRPARVPGSTSSRSATVAARSTSSRPTRGRRSTTRSTTTHTDDLAAAVAKVRKGDADVAVEMRRRHAGRPLHADRPGAGGHHAGHPQRVRRRRPTWTRRASRRRTPCAPSGSRTESLKTIQFVTPGLLGWAVAMSAAFGAAATLQGWRNSKLLRRLQLSPVPAGLGRRRTGRWSRC